MAVQSTTDRAVVIMRGHPQSSDFLEIGNVCDSEKRKAADIAEEGRKLRYGVIDSSEVDMHTARLMCSQNFIFGQTCEKVR